MSSYDPSTSPGQDRSSVQYRDSPMDESSVAGDEVLPYLETASEDDEGGPLVRSEIQDSDEESAMNIDSDPVFPTPIDTDRRIVERDDSGEDALLQTLALAGSAAGIEHADKDTKEIGDDEAGERPVAAKDPVAAEDGKVQPHLDMLRGMRERGCPDKLIPWPFLAVLGEQNVGKTLLINRLTGFKLPSAQGTSTRSPIELRLSRSPYRFSCTISITRDYVYDADADADDLPAASPGYPRFTHATRSSAVEFAYTNDQSNVEELIERAHCAVLNPTQESSMFRDPSTPVARFLTRSAETTFSPNTILVKASGPGLDDLTVLDLPGLITTRGVIHGDIPPPDVLTKLAVEHVGGLNTLVLVTSLLSSEANTSLAKRVASDNRIRHSISVLTKADVLVPSALRDRLIQISHNDELDYVVANRCGVTGLEIDAAAEDEKFDALCESDPALKPFRRRLGLSYLRTAIMEGLDGVVRHRLPQVQQHILKKISETENSLSGFPPTKVRDAMLAFDKALRLAMSEVTELSRKRGAEQIRLAEQLMARLEDSAPRLVDEGTQQQNLGEKRAAAWAKPASKKQRREDIDAKDATHALPRYDPVEWQASDLRLSRSELIRGPANGPDQPSQTPQFDLYQDAIRHWNKAGEDYRQRMSAKLESDVKQVLKKHCKAFINTKVWSKILGELTLIFEEIRQKMRERLGEIVESEKELPNMWHDTILTAVVAAIEKNLRSERKTEPVGSQHGSAPRSSKLSKSEKDILTGLVANYRLSAPRFAGNVSMQLHFVFRTHFGEMLERLTLLCDPANEAAAQLMKLSASASQARERLHAQRKALKWAAQKAMVLNLDG